MIPLGRQEPDWSVPCGTSANAEDDRPKRTVYPEIRIASDKPLPKLPADEFYFLARGKKTMYRTPPDGKGEYVCEISVMEMQPVDDAAARDMMGEESEETPLRREMARMRSAAEKAEPEEY